LRRLGAAGKQACRWLVNDCRSLTGGKPWFEADSRTLPPRRRPSKRTIEASRLGLSRRDDVAIAYFAHLRRRTLPPELLVITREKVDKILADEDRDVHDIAPAEWGHSQMIVP
jgi:hypothetical protein